MGFLIRGLTYMHLVFKVELTCSKTNELLSNRAIGYSIGCVHPRNFFTSSSCTSSFSGIFFKTNLKHTFDIFMFKVLGDLNV